MEEERVKELRTAAVSLHDALVALETAEEMLDNFNEEYGEDC